ncbi:MAG: amidohydrolase family protein [Candidatus Firestonebacteria bacterium]
MKSFVYKSFTLFLIISTSLLSQSSINMYDIVILEGRIINPESQTDKTLNIGIKDGKIVEVTESAIAGKMVVDAKGLTVSPGFIDILSYDPNGYGEICKVYDGVTTNLSMHGASELDFKRLYNKGVIVNCGGAVSQVKLRYAVGLMNAYDKPTSSQIIEMVKLAKKAIEDGALGISFSFEYNPGTTHEEAETLFRVAKEYKVLCTVHLRYSTMEGDKTNIEAINEVIDLCKNTGASCQIVHINSTGGTFSMRESLELIQKAKEAGLDISIDMYPYNYWATYLASSRFDGDWQKRFKISYNDLQIGGTSERLNKDSFKKYRKLNPLVVAYAIPEEDIIVGLKSPLTMIGSDTILNKNKNNHPRGAGCFSRLLGKYVREEKTISLMEAINKITLMQAKRLENISSSMKNKGRIKIGADADITIFNSNTIIDKATVEDPAIFSEGIEYVIVNGVIVKDKNGIVKNALPGRKIENMGRLF